MALTSAARGPRPVQGTRFILGVRFREVGAALRGGRGGTHPAPCPRRRNSAAQGRNMENQQETAVGEGGRKPWAAYNIIERQGGKRIWSRVGSAFKNRD